MSQESNTALIPLQNEGFESTFEPSLDEVSDGELLFEEQSLSVIFFNSRFKLYALYAVLFFAVTLFVFGIMTVYAHGSVSEAGAELFQKLCVSHGSFSFLSAFKLVLPCILCYASVFLSGLTIFAPIISFTALLFDFSVGAFVYGSGLAYATPQRQHLFVLCFTGAFALISFFKILFCAEVSMFSKLASHGVRRSFRPNNFIPYFLCFVLFSLVYYAFSCINFLLFGLI